MLKINLPYKILDPARDDSSLTVVGVVEIDSEKWSFPMHAHQDLADLVLITSGRGMLTYHGKTVETVKGDLLIFNQDALHAESSQEEDPLTEICISLNGVQIDGFHRNHIIPEDMFPLVKSEEQFPLLNALFHYLMEVCIHREENYEIICQDAAKVILSLIQKKVRVEYTKMPDYHIGFHVIMDIVTYLDEHYNENIKLEDISNQFHFSPYYISHKFKEEMHLSINQYVINRRIGEAQKLLIYTDLPITEISRRLGYENLTHFYITFKKNTGFAPGQFRDHYMLKRLEKDK